METGRGRGGRQGSGNVLAAQTPGFRKSPGKGISPNPLWGGVRSGGVGAGGRERRGPSGAGRGPDLWGPRRGASGCYCRAPFPRPAASPAPPFLSGLRPLLPSRHPLRPHCPLSGGIPCRLFPFSPPLGEAGATYPESCLPHPQPLFCLLPLANFSFRPFFSHPWDCL